MIEKILERLEELEVDSSCNDCPYAETCDKIQETASSKTDLCGATMKALAIEIVQEVAKEYGNGWIPCSERLPEIEGNTSDTVLVCAIDGYRHMAFWCDDEKWRYCESGEIRNPIDWTEIIAWQPLPAPYQKGE